MSYTQWATSVANLSNKLVRLIKNKWLICTLSRQKNRPERDKRLTCPSSARKIGRRPSKERQAIALCLEFRAKNILKLPYRQPTHWMIRSENLGGSKFFSRSHHRAKAKEGVIRHTHLKSLNDAQDTLPLERVRRKFDFGVTKEIDSYPVNGPNWM